MGERYDHLTSDERKLIFQLRQAKMSAPRIAERLGRRVDGLAQPSRRVRR